MKKTLFTVLVAISVCGTSLAAGKILAEVNGKAITKEDLEKVVKTLPPNYMAMKNNPAFRKRLLKDMVKEELLYQEALKEGVDKDPKVKEEIELMRKRILVQALLRKHIKPAQVSVSESEAKTFYEKNKGRFKDPNGRPVPYQSIKPFIVQALKQYKEQQAFREALDRYISNLEKHSKVKIYVK